MSDQPFATRVPFHQYGDLLAQGWTLQGHEFHPESLELVVHMTPPAGWTPPAPEPVFEPDAAGAPAEGRLHQLLDDLVFAAESAAGVPKRLPLKKGLRIDLLIGAGRTRLQLSRQGTYPSDQEWHTVLFYWPTQLPSGISYVRQQKGNEFYLCASWATPG
jgi:hypothetical protein